MSLPIGPMIGAASKIAEYFELIEGVNTKIKLSIQLKRT